MTTPRNVIRSLLPAAVVAFSVVALPPLPAHAAATLSLSPASATPGTVVTVTGTGFPTFGGNQIRVTVGQSAVASVPYQPPNFTATFATPQLTPGFYTVTACVAVGTTCSSAPGTSAQARLQILAPAPTRTPPRPPSPRPSRSQPPPSGPGDLRITLDPVCCDPPPPSDPPTFVGPPSPTPGLGLKNPGNPPNFPDLYIFGIEVSQNIQDVYSNMPLVAGRKTVIRVHPRANTGNWAPIDGAILLEHGGQQEVLYPVNGPITTGLTVDRADLDSALNFVLEPKWYAEGTLKISALVWAYGPNTLDDKEPNPENNFMRKTVVFKTAKEPTVHLVPLDDGAGPGPSPTLAWTVFSSLFVSNNIVRNHPIAATNLKVYPIPVGPGTGTSGASRLGAVLSTSTGRTQPLQKLFWYHQVLGLAEDERLFGLFDNGIPAGGYSGWAKSNLRSAWTKPSGTTPSHEAAHLTGLGHVDCVGTEEAGGALDPTHPNAAPDCSLAPVSKAGYFGLTVYDPSLTIYSNDPAHPQAAFPLMSYAGTKWNDAYHWCKMLTFYGVPCSPDAIGVPGKPVPNPTNVDVDCDESVAGPGGIELKVCVSGSGAPTSDNYPNLSPDKLTMAVPARPTAWLLVTGTLSNGGGTITQASLVDKLAPSLAALAAADEAAARRGGGGANEIALQDSSGRTVARVKVGELDVHGAPESSRILTHGNGGSQTAVGEFAKVVPVAGDIATVVLLANGKTMATQRMSARPPTIGDVRATPGADGIRVTWSASDPDGDPVTSSVLWSADGKAWVPVALDTTTTSVLVGAGVQLPGGPAVRVKVVANDGVRTSESISAPFPVANNAPLVSVGELPDGSTIPRYHLGDLTALGYDPEDGQLAAAKLVWRSNVDGEIGTGTRLSLRRLSVGEHTITVTATDTAGATGTGTIRLKVVDTGAPALRVQGANLDAERRLRAGAAVPANLTWLWVALGAVVPIAVLAGVWFVRRRRAKAAPATV